MKPIAATIEFTEELSKVLSHGAPMGKALDIISGDLSDKNLRRFFLTSNFEDIDTEKFLLMIKAKPEYFPGEIIHMYDKALKSSDPSKSLLKLIGFMKLRKEFEDKKDKILKFSSLVIIFSFICMLLIKFFLGAYVSLFEDMDVDLPLPTQILMSLTKLTNRPLSMSLLSLLLVVVLYFILFKSEAVIRCCLKIPVFKKIILNEYLTYSYRSLAYLIDAGYYLKDAVREIKSQKTMTAVRHLIITSDDKKLVQNEVSDEKKDKLFSDFVLDEQAGEIDKNTFTRTVRDEAESLKRANHFLTEKVSFVLQPIIVFSFVIFVCWLLIALFLPMYQP